jgi:tetratricopeptide (TPR) repeat protein
MVTLIKVNIFYLVLEIIINKFIYNKGNVLNDLGKPEEALTCYDKAIEHKEKKKEKKAIVYHNKGYNFFIFIIILQNNNDINNFKILNEGLTL